MSLLRLVSLSCLLLFSIVSFVFEQEINTHPTADFLTFQLILGWTLLIIYGLILYRRQYIFICSMFYQLFYFAGILVSASFISFGSFMFEIQQTGSANGTFWIAIIFLIISLEAGLLGFKQGSFITSHHKNFSSSFHKIIIFLLVATTCIISIYILLRYGNPVQSESNRVQFWGHVAPKYLSFIRIFILLSFFFPIQAVITSPRKSFKRKFWSVIVAFYIFLALILLGEKFSIFIIYMFTALIVSAAVLRFTQIKKTLRYCFLFLAVLIVYVLVAYKDLGPYFIFDRIALQSQVLWSVMEEPSNILMNGITLNQAETIPHDIKDAIALRYLPTRTYLSHLSVGTTLSGHFPAWGILLIGLPLTLVCHTLFSFVLGMIQRTLIVTIQRRSSSVAFIYFTLYFACIMVWFVGNFNLFALVGLCIASTCLYQLISQNKIL